MARHRLLAAWLLAEALLPAWPRPLPDKNELANACYFTYRVGYVICDPGLSPEEAKRAVEEHKCNEDFRLVGSDFQRKVVAHYASGGPPPLEEATWMLNAPENFQGRTLKECPAMQLVAYVLIAEAKLFLQPSPAADPSTASSAEIVAHALEQMRQVPAEVLSALGKAWPMDVALARFEATSRRLALLASERQAAGFQVHLVACACSVQELTWLTEPELLSEGSTLFVYATCWERDGGATDAAASFLAGRAASAGASVVLAKVDQDFGTTGECSARGVLSHVVRASNSLESPEAEVPDFTVFLPARIPPEGSQRRFLEVVLRSLAKRTLEVGFLALSLRRSSPRAPSDCARALYRRLFGAAAPAGYEGARFVLSKEQLTRRSPAEYRGLLALLEGHGEAPEACAAEAGAGGRRALLEEAFGRGWHVVFGEDPWLPTRADDSRLPPFLRFLDGPSGFEGSRLPQVSHYLASISGSQVTKQ